MKALIKGLFRYKDKMDIGESVSSLMLCKDFGIEGDFHQGKDRQVSFLSTEARQKIDLSAKKGLCFSRYRENILFEGFSLKELYEDCELQIGNVILRMDSFRKPCFDECTLCKEGMKCPLSGHTLFATVEKGGAITLLDEIVLIEE